MQNNKKAFIITIISLVIIVVLYFGLNPYISKLSPKKDTPSITLNETAYNTDDWYLYKTKNNDYFEIKYPADWKQIYGGGFEGEDYLDIRSSDSKTVFKILARSNNKYFSLEDYIKEIDRPNEADPSKKILKEEKLLIDGHQTIKREMYGEGIFNGKMVKGAYIDTYIYTKKDIISIFTFFPGSENITPEQTSLYNSVLSTLKLIN